MVNDERKLSHIYENLSNRKPTQFLRGECEHIKLYGTGLISSVIPFIYSITHFYNLLYKSRKVLDIMDNIFLISKEL